MKIVVMPLPLFCHLIVRCFTGYDYKAQHLFFRHAPDGAVHCGNTDTGPFLSGKIMHFPSRKRPACMLEDAAHQLLLNGITRAFSVGHHKFSMIKAGCKPAPQYQEIFPAREEHPYRCCSFVVPLKGCVILPLQCGSGQVGKKHCPRR